MRAQIAYKQKKAVSQLSDSAFFVLRILYRKYFINLHQSLKMTQADDTIKRLSQGHKSVFNDLFEQYYERLYHLSYQYLNNEDEAKDIVQDTFIKLWEVRADLNPDTNIRNFLFTITKNNCLNMLKRRQFLIKEHEKIKWAEMHYAYEALNRMGHEYMEFEELKEKIETAVERLPKYCQRVFLMSRFEDRKNKEIAEELNISIKTVEAHLTKALKLLRSDLKEYLPLIVTITTLLS